MLLRDMEAVLILRQGPESLCNLETQLRVKKGLALTVMVNRELQAAYSMLVRMNQAVKKQLAYHLRSYGIIDATPLSLTTAGG